MPWIVPLRLLVYLVVSSQSKKQAYRKKIHSQKQIAQNLIDLIYKIKPG